MKATYADFIQSNKNCSNFEFNPDAQKIFDFLNQDENIIKMIEYTEQGKPALAGCVVELETFFNSLINPTVDLNDGFTRTAVGRMVKCILEPFGYGVDRQKDFPKNKKGHYFTSASCYNRNDQELVKAATMHVVKRIEEITR